MARPTAWKTPLAFGIVYFIRGATLFWAEQRVPSGVATQRLTIRLALALLVGIAGIAVLTTMRAKAPA